jgi:hypothetical protein
LNRTRFACALAMAALAAILLPSILPAQITFQRTYGGIRDEMGWLVQQTIDEGYIVAGSTYSFGAGATDVFLLKLNASGDTLWMRTYGGSREDHGYCVQQTSDGGYIATGGTGSFGVGGDLYLVKTDASGDTQWTRAHGGSQGDCGYAVQQTSDSGYIIAGCTGSFGAGDNDVYLVKTDTDGDTMWTGTFGGPRSDCAYSVQQTPDDGYIIAGHTLSYGAGGDDIYLVKTDARGDTQWTKTFGGSQNDVGNSVLQTADGGYAVAGTTGSFGAGDRDLYLLRTDANGDTLWTKTFGGYTTDVANSVRQATDRGYAIVGTTFSFGNGTGEVYLVRADSCGHLLWTRAFGGDSLEYGLSVDLTNDGGYVLAGMTKSFGADGEDIYVIKTDAGGNVTVTEPKASSTRTPALSLTCEPNPCRGTTTIRLSQFAPSQSPSTLKVFDSQGRLVVSQPVRTSSFPLSTSDLPSGAYFLRLDVGGQHAHTRLVVQR